MVGQSSSLHPVKTHSFIGLLTHTRRSDGVPDPDGTLQTVSRDKIRSYRQIQLSRPESIVFMSVSVDTSDRVIYRHASRQNSEK